MRLLIIAALVYLLYRGFKSWMLKNLPPSQPPEGRNGSMTGVDDVMVKDPICEVYFPKRNGIEVKADGESHYFCSTECRDKYLAAKSSKEEPKS
jgi:YHS domain-containing protein